jgi:hypothetical protein
MVRAGRHLHVPPPAGTPDGPGPPPDQTPGTQPGKATSQAATDPGATPGGQGARRALTRSATARVKSAPPAARQVALLVGYLAAGVAVTWPRATYLAGRLPSSRDSAAYVWGFWWVARQVSQFADPWHTNHMAAPAGVQLGYHTLMPLPGLLLTPVTLLFGPSASYNLLVIVVPGLLCYTMYRAARLWLPSPAGAIAAGAFFGLSAMLAQEDWYHVNIAAGAVFLPLALEASVRLRRASGVRPAVWLGVVMGAVVLTDPESAVMAAILTALVLLPWLLRRPSVTRLWPALLAVAAGAVIASPQLLSIIQEQVRGGLRINGQLLGVTDKLYGVGLPGMFAPTPRVADFGLVLLTGPFTHSRDNEGLPMFGVTLTLLALGGLVVAWRRRRTRLLGLLWLGCAMLALGASLWVGQVQYVPFAQIWNGVQVSPILPYTWFVRIPGLSAFREADRLAILGLVPAALLAGAAVDWMRGHARALLAVAVALGVLDAGYSGNPKIGSMPTTLPALDAPIAADHSRSIVVDVPFGLRGGIPQYGGRFAPEAMVLATADGHPRAIAYVSRIPQPTLAAIGKHAFYSYLIHAQHYSVAPPALPAQRVVPIWAEPPTHYSPVTAAQVRAARRDARRLHIGWVVVWRDNAAITQYLEETGFRFAYRSGDVPVYRPASGDT